MTELKVECYAGYKADQRPVKFKLGNQTLEIQAIEDQWYSPDSVYFRVRAADGNIYVLRHHETADSWTLEAFRRSNADNSEPGNS